MPSVNETIGPMIRELRMKKGLSQGDLEERTGLLRCYVSRVENGHTVPSLVTLAKIAEALETPIAELFPAAAPLAQTDGRALAEEEIRFLSEIQRYTAELDAGDRRILLAIVRKFASQAGA